MTNARAFTLVEALVVVSILIVLIAILIPVLNNARRAAKRQLCATRLRALAQSTLMYKTDNRTFPAPLMNYQYGSVVPADIQIRILNDLSPYLGNYPTLTNASTLQNLPNFLRCVFVEEWSSSYDGPWSDCRNAAGQQVNYFYVGYAYYYGLDHPSSGGQILPNGKDRFIPTFDSAAPPTAILWGDGVGVWRSAGQDAVYYTHVRGPRKSSTVWPFAHTSTAAFEGAHTALLDGSVTWKPATSYSIDLANKDASASYKTHIDWWFWF